VTAIQPLGRFGVMQINANQSVDVFKEKMKDDEGWINGGFFVLRPEVFQYIPDNADDIMWEDNPLADLTKADQLMAYQHHGFWNAWMPCGTKWTWKRSGIRVSQMEAMVMHGLFGGVYKGRRVLLTGHSGFKGSWLLLWLRQLGAEVAGYSLEPATDPAHILCSGCMTRHRLAISTAEKSFAPSSPVSTEIVLHLAAQPLVRRSYAQPLETFQTNVIGTANVLDAARLTPRCGRW